MSHTLTLGTNNDIIARYDEVRPCGQLIEHIYNKVMIIMSKRILLVVPFIYTDAVFDPIRACQNIGLKYLGSFLKALGHTVEILDCVLEGFDQRKLVGSDKSYSQFTAEKLTDVRDLDAAAFSEKYNAEGYAGRPVVRTGLALAEIVERVRAFNPDIVGISIFASCNHISALETAKAIKNAFPHIKIVAGGAHATDMAEVVLRDSEGAIDICVRGEGFAPLQQIVEGITPEIGVAYLDDEGNLIDKGEAVRIAFSDFPDLDPELYEHISLPKSAPHTHQTHGKWTDVMFSRGCHRGCEFCVAGSKCYRYQALGLDKAEEQLRRLKAAGYEHLILQDDDLLQNLNFFYGVLELISKYDFSWQDNGGVSIEDLSPEVGQKIIDNGRCTALYVPFNPRAHTVAQAAGQTVRKYGVNVEGLKRLRAKGVYVYTSGIVGLNVHSRENIESEVEEYKSLIAGGYVDQALIFPVSHLPATRNHTLFAKDIEDPAYWLGYSIFVPHARTQTMVVREVELAVIWANMELNNAQSQAGPWGSAFPKI